MLYSPYRWYVALTRGSVFHSLTVCTGLVHHYHRPQQCFHSQWPRSSHRLSSAGTDLLHLVSQRHPTAYRHLCHFLAETGRCGTHCQAHGAKETWHLVPIFHRHDPSHRLCFILYLCVCAMRSPITLLEPHGARSLLVTKCPEVYDDIYRLWVLYFEECLETVALIQRQHGPPLWIWASLYSPLPSYGTSRWNEAAKLVSLSSWALVFCE